MSKPGSIRWSLGLVLLALGGHPTSSSAFQSTQPAQLTAEEDRKRLMDLLHIASLRHGADARHPDAPNAINYDESKANPYPHLPDPLVMKNGRKVTTAAMWWNERRPEIVEDFDREIYGRVPRETPGVKWEVVKSAREMNGEVPVIVKQLVGHVDNSSYPRIAVDIQMTLTTPANAAGSVPVVMEFSYMGRPRMPASGTSPPVAAGPTWQQQVLAKGWGYANLSPTSIQADNGQGLTERTLRTASWGIDSVGLVVAAALLTLKFLRKGNDLVAAGFLVFAIGEGVILSGTAATLAESVPSFAAGAALWSAALLLTSVPREFAGWVRLAGLIAAILFAITAARIFWGEPLLPTASPLPFFAYPFLVLTFAGWIWTLLKEA